VQAECALRLYLSSFNVGNRPERLAELARGAKRAAIVVNALDHRENARAEWLENQRSKLSALGFDVVELDLRQYFGREHQLRLALDEIDVVWINGGNAFILRRAMKQSAFDVLITERLGRDTIVYAGFSAATVIVSHDLRGLDAVSNPSEVPAGYDSEIVWDGLRFLPYALVVHFKSDHPESAAVEDEVAHYEKNGVPYRTLRDGEALVVDGERVEIIG
jgi:dipeptidase E